MSTHPLPTSPRGARYYWKLLTIASSLTLVLGALALLADWRGATLAADPALGPGPQPGLGWRLLRALLPSALAIGLALVLPATFVAALYRLTNWRDGALHLWRCALGRPMLGPWIHVAEGELKASDQHLLGRIGGPGGILVANDSAAVLARGGILTRVLGPGTLAELAPFERLVDVLDVRPMRWEWHVHALTKEGIPVTLAVDAQFQVDTDRRPTSDQAPYPATPEAIFRASTGRWVRQQALHEEEETFDWARRVVLSDTEASVRDIVARYPLDALIDPDELAAIAKRGGTDEHSSRPTARPGEHPRQALEAELEAALRKLAAPLGVQINEVRLGAIQVDEDIQAQWVEAWMSRWQYWALVQRKSGEVSRQQQRDMARAQAQVDMITAVARVFEEATARDTRIPAQLLVMRLLEVFDRSSIGPQTYLPDQALDTLERLRSLLA